jgi:hypothetical protein
MTRATRLLSLAAAAALAVAACGGSVSTTAPSEAPAVSAPTLASEAPPLSAPPSEAPAASVAAGGPDVNAAAAALDDIDKYALDLKVSGLMETASEANEITMSGTVDREAGSYQFDMSGVAGLEDLGGGSAVSFVVIGPDAWISTGDGNFIKAPGGAAMFGSLEQALAPGTLLGSIPTGSLQNLPAVGQEEKNGAAATHYHVTGADSPQVAEGLGPDSVVDLWIADDGGYIVSMAMDGIVPVNGTDTPVTMSIDISRINDESIAIEAPN